MLLIHTVVDMTFDTSIYYPEDRGISESIDYGRNMAKKIIECFENK